MPFAPTQTENHDSHHAAHPCRPSIRFGDCGIYCDRLRATTFGRHTHPTVQIVATAAESDYLLSWQQPTGRWQHTPLAGEQVVLIPAGLRHAVQWHRPASLVTLLVGPDFALAAAGGKVLRQISCLPLRHYSAVTPIIGELCTEAWRAGVRPGHPNLALIGPLGLTLASQILHAHFAPTDRHDPNSWLFMRTKLEDVFRYIDDHLGEDLSLSPQIS